MDAALGVSAGGAGCMSRSLKKKTRDNKNRKGRKTDGRRVITGRDYI